jgi:uncharacterized sulfatase
MKDDVVRPYFIWAHAKRPEYELFDIKNDPYNLNNLAGKPEFAAVEQELKQALLAELKKSKDPRVVGSDKEIFDSYKRYVGPMREFPKP